MLVAHRVGHVQRAQQHARPERVGHRRRPRVAEERHESRRTDHGREDERLQPAPHGPLHPSGKQDEGQRCRRL